VKEMGGNVGVLIWSIDLPSRWEDKSKMALQEVKLGDMDWIDLAQDRGRWQTLVNAVMNLRVPKMWGIS